MTLVLSYIFVSYYDDINPKRYQCCSFCFRQKQATVRSSVLEVLLEITKFCDLYLMERVLDDESEVCVLCQHKPITHHILSNEVNETDAQFVMLYAVNSPFSSVINILKIPKWFCKVELSEMCYSCLKQKHLPKVQHLELLLSPLSMKQ